MIQQLIVYTILLGALSYVGYRLYSSIRKKAACDKCELMKAAKDIPAKK